MIRYLQLKSDFLINSQNTLKDEIKQSIVNTKPESDNQPTEIQSVKLKVDDLENKLNRLKNRNDWNRIKNGRNVTRLVKQLNTAKSKLSDLEV